VSPRLLATMARLPKVCRHLHLPVQSGSTRVLRAMRRRYTRESYLALIDRIRGTLPDVALSTDIIIGFPGETEADFEQTLSLVGTVQYHSIFSFKYSPRPNTLAIKRLVDDVSAPDKTRRIVALQQLQRSIQSDLNARFLGRDVEVLIDSVSRRRDTELSGRTTGNLVVNVPGPAAWIGRTVSVRIERAGPHSLWGRAACPFGREDDDVERAVAPPVAAGAAFTPSSVADVSMQGSIGTRWTIEGPTEKG
jgi:tRNA-2-methylthio-N6-dimethylallyladenosine synthase